MNLPDVPLMSMLKLRMSWLHQRQDTLSQNVANADTPGYQAQELDFEKALGKALESGSDAAGVRGEIHNQVNNIVREDGNTVDRDAEDAEDDQRDTQDAGLEVHAGLDPTQRLTHHDLQSCLKS